MRSGTQRGAGPPRARAQQSTALRARMQLHPRCDETCSFLTSYDLDNNYIMLLFCVIKLQLFCIILY